MMIHRFLTLVNRFSLIFVVILTLNLVLPASIADAQVTCNASNTGRLYFSTGTGQLQLCDGTGWYPIAATGTGYVGIGTTSPTALLQLYNSSRGGEIGIGQQNDYTPYMRLGMDTSWVQFLANNAYWTGSAYNYVNTGGYGGLASRFSQSSGTMSFDTVSGGTNPISWTSRLYINNGGSVGIGTTTPVAPLDLLASGVRFSVHGNLDPSGFTASTTWGTLGSSPDGLAVGWNRSAGGRETNFVNLAPAQTPGGFTFDTWNGTTYTNMVKITSSGYLTTPQQVFFEAKLCSSTVNASGVMIWETVVTNTGSAYSSATGKFTAPVAGVYTFGFNTLMNYLGSGEYRYEFYKNGGLYNSIIAQKTANTWQTIQGTTSTYLNAGDTFYVNYSSGSGATYIDCNYDRFWGRLSG